MAGIGQQAMTLLHMGLSQGGRGEQFKGAAGTTSPIIFNKDQHDRNFGKSL
jgi:hypothetical protein